MTKCNVPNTIICLYCPSVCSKREPDVQRIPNNELSATVKHTHTRAQFAHFNSLSSHHIHIKQIFNSIHIHMREQICARNICTQWSTVIRTKSARGRCEWVGHHHCACVVLHIYAAYKYNVSSKPSTYVQFLYTLILSLATGCV